MKYTKELLEPIVQQAQSIAQVIRALGLREAGGTYSHIKRVIIKHGLDMSHFTGMGHMRNKPAYSRLCWQKVLVKRSCGTRQKAHILRRALIEYGREYKCECGQLPIWNNKELRLQVDHRNQDWLDDSPENIRFLCPNCHTQTPGYNGSLGLSTVTDRKYGRVAQRQEAYRLER